MDDFERFYNLALRFLSYRTRSEKEVRDKLKLKIKKLATTETQKNLEAQKIIDRVIEKLKEQKFINDEEFARQFVENRLRLKPRSLRLIKMELRQKGIDAEIIERLVASRGSQVADDLEQAKKLAEKRLPRYQGLGRQKIYEKLGRYLASKGFSWDTIKKSIDETLDKGV